MIPEKNHTIDVNSFHEILELYKNNSLEIVCYQLNVPWIGEEEK